MKSRKNRLASAMLCAALLTLPACALAGETAPLIRNTRYFFRLRSLNSSLLKLAKNRSIVSSLQDHRALLVPDLRQEVVLQGRVEPQGLLLGVKGEHLPLV